MILKNKNKKKHPFPNNFNLLEHLVHQAMNASLVAPVRYLQHFKKYSRRNFFRTIFGLRFHLFEIELMNCGQMLVDKIHLSTKGEVIEDGTIVPNASNNSDYDYVDIKVHLKQCPESLLCRKLRQEFTRISMNNPIKEKGRKNEN